MIGRICVTLVFVLWPFVGIVYGVLDGDWSIFWGFLMFWTLALALTVFSVLVALIWQKDKTDADKY